MADQRTVTVIIPTFEEPRLALCLDAVAALTTPEGASVDVIVADNGSAEPPADEVGRHPGSTLLVETRRGSYAARNTAVRASGSDVYAFTDADCRPTPSWLVEALRALDADPTLAAVAGRVSMDFPHGRPTTPCDWWESLEAFPQEGYVKSGFGVTANLVVRADVLRALGGFDDDAISGGDVDFGRRLHAAGHRLAYAPDAVVLHPPRSTWSQLLGKTRRTTRGLSRLNHLAGRTDRQLLVDLRTQWLNLLRSVKKAATNGSLPGPGARVRYLVAALAVHFVIITETARSEIGLRRSGPQV